MIRSRSSLTRFETKWARRWRIRLAQKKEKRELELEKQRLLKKDMETASGLLDMVAELHKQKKHEEEATRLRIEEDRKAQMAKLSGILQAQEEQISKMYEMFQKHNVLEGPEVAKTELKTMIRRQSEGATPKSDSADAQRLVLPPLTPQSKDKPSTPRDNKDGNVIPLSPRRAALASNDSRPNTSGHSLSPRPPSTPSKNPPSPRSANLPRPPSAGPNKPSISPRQARSRATMSVLSPSSEKKAQVAPVPLRIQIKICDNCDKHVALFRCDDCQLSLCPPCDTGMHKPRRTGNHVRITLYAVQPSSTAGDAPPDVTPKEAAVQETTPSEVATTQEIPAVEKPSVTQSDLSSSRPLDIDTFASDTPGGTSILKTTLLADIVDVSPVQSPTSSRRPSVQEDPIRPHVTFGDTIVNRFPVEPVVVVVQSGRAVTPPTRSNTTLTPRPPPKSKSQHRSTGFSPRKNTAARQTLGSNAKLAAVRALAKAAATKKAERRRSDEAKPAKPDDATSVVRSKTAKSLADKRNTQNWNTIESKMKFTIDTLPMSESKTRMDLRKSRQRRNSKRATVDPWADSAFMPSAAGDVWADNAFFIPPAPAAASSQTSEITPSATLQESADTMPSTSSSTAPIETVSSSVPSVVASTSTSLPSSSIASTSTSEDTGPEKSSFKDSQSSSVSTSCAVLATTHQNVTSNVHDSDRGISHKHSFEKQPKVEVPKASEAPETKTNADGPDTARAISMRTPPLVHPFMMSRNRQTLQAPSTLAASTTSSVGSLTSQSVTAPMSSVPPASLPVAAIPTAGPAALTKPSLPSIEETSATISSTTTTTTVTTTTTTTTTIKPEIDATHAQDTQNHSKPNENAATATISDKHESTPNENPPKPDAGTLLPRKGIMTRAPVGYSPRHLRKSSSVNFEELRKYQLNPLPVKFVQLGALYNGDLEKDISSTSSSVSSKIFSKVVEKSTPEEKSETETSGDIKSNDEMTNRSQVSITPSEYEIVPAIVIARSDSNFVPRTQREKRLLRERPWLSGTSSKKGRQSAGSPNTLAESSPLDNAADTRRSSMKLANTQSQKPRIQRFASLRYDPVTRIVEEKVPGDGGRKPLFRRADSFVQKE